MNVAFVTLFLGLVVGPQDVQVTVGDRVTAVELRLDGTLIARVGPPEWKAPVEFGPEPLPHELEAVGFDAEGNETDHALIRVNLPRPQAEASFLIDRPDATGRQVGHLTWEFGTASEPRTIRLTLDDELLDVEDPSRFEIPPGEPGSIDGPADAVFLVDPEVEPGLRAIARKKRWRASRRAGTPGAGRWSGFSPTAPSPIYGPSRAPGSISGR